MTEFTSGAFVYSQSNTDYTAKTWVNGQLTGTNEWPESVLIDDDFYGFPYYLWNFQYLGIIPNGTMYGQVWFCDYAMLQPPEPVPSASFGVRCVGSQAVLDDNDDLDGEPLPFSDDILRL